MKINILESSSVGYPDPEAHVPGCFSEQPDVLDPDPITSYVNLFLLLPPVHRAEDSQQRNRHRLAAGWTEEQTMEWRAANGLAQAGASLM
jgi:hypothetical protein